MASSEAIAHAYGQGLDRFAGQGRIELLAMTGTRQGVDGTGVVLERGVSDIDLGGLGDIVVRTERVLARAVIGGGHGRRVGLEILTG